MELILIKWFYIITRKYPLRRYILGVLTHTTAWDRLLGGWTNSSFGLKFSRRCFSALLHSAVVWFAFWNSDHVVLKSSIRTSASPRRQRSHWGLRVTQDAYFLLLTHTKQLLLVTFCDTLAGIEVSFWTDRTGTTDGRTDGLTERRGSQNSYLDTCLYRFLMLKEITTIENQNPN